MKTDHRFDNSHTHTHKQRLICRCLEETEAKTPTPASVGSRLRRQTGCKRLRQELRLQTDTGAAVTQAPLREPLLQEPLNLGTADGSKREEAHFRDNYFQSRFEMFFKSPHPSKQNFHFTK